MLNPTHIDALILDLSHAALASGSSPMARPLADLGRRLRDRGIQVFPFPTPEDALRKAPRELLVGSLHWLDVQPNRTAILTSRPEVADAAREHGLALVCGLARKHEEGPLRKAGVHLVARRPEDVDRVEVHPTSPFDHLGAIRATLAEFEPVVMLDYDGTLTPIVEDPSQALLSSDVRETVRKLVAIYPTAVVSGRGLRDVKALVDLEGIWYAGSHGAELFGPTGETSSLVPAGSLPELEAVASELSARLALIPGAQLEHKRSALAVHYRRVSPDRIPEVEWVVEDVVSGAEVLCIGYGKMVFEVQPSRAWDKGRAVQWVLEELELEPTRAVPLYIGDDITDENAFRAVKPNGIGILVSDEPRPTFADYRLADPGDVHRFLRELVGA